MAVKHPHVALADDYIREVLNGRTPACKWTKLACERQREDRKRWTRKTKDPFLFDKDDAERVCNFKENLPHIKGEWARRGDYIKLEPWQCFVNTSVFGWKHAKSGLRRFKTVYVEVARKNAKSTLASGIALYMLTEDGEEGAEVFSAATTRDQARIVFRDSQAMARKEPDFREHYGVTVATHNIHVLGTNSKYEPLSAEANTLDGLNTHCAIVDELHAHKTRAVYDVLETSLGARQQPLLWCITTAGSNRAGICYEVRSYLTKILERVTEDDSFFGCIWTIDDNDDWTDPAVWQKANPNYGVSVYPEDIARLCKKAQQTPSAVNNFLTKRLNVWCNADTAWMDMRAWDKCGDPDLCIEDFEGESCFVGIDLASKIDIAAKVKLFERNIDGEKHYYLFGDYYLPEETIEASGNSQYQGWERAGWLKATPGNVIDFVRIEDELQEDTNRFKILDVAYDPFQATEFSTRMLEQCLPMVEVRPTVLNFSEPMKQFEALVLDGKLHHPNDPVLTWAVSNVVCHRDYKDNIYPRKEIESNKIDPVVASLMALNRQLRGERFVSRYDDTEAEVFSL